MRGLVRWLAGKVVFVDFLLLLVDVPQKCCMYVNHNVGKKLVGSFFKAISVAEILVPQRGLCFLVL